MNFTIQFSQQDLFAAILFWSAFAFSAGPFWTATMSAATTTSFGKLYSDYMIYLIVGWLPLIAFCAALVFMFGELGKIYLIGLHVAGILVVFAMAWKIFKSVPGVQGDFDFNWKAMSLLSWTNPKVWLLVPVGFINARVTGIIWLDVWLYGLVGIPLFLLGVYVWGSLGRLGARISFKYINRFNAFLMALFGLYLFYSAVNLIAEK